MQIAAGTYLLVNHGNRAAFVKVAGNVVNVCPGSEPCYEELRNVTASIVDTEGVPVAGGEGEGASLEFIDGQLFGTNRSNPILPIQVPADRGPSIVNNQAWFEDAQGAIAYVLYTQRGINPNDIERNTVVTVVWPDGSKAQFVRKNKSGTVQWFYVEGSARNANGQKIDPNTGAVIGATASTGGAAGGEVSVPGANGSSFVMAAEAGWCVSRQRFYFNGNYYGQWEGIVRCN
jgi:hypothetical protein